MEGLIYKGDLLSERYCGHEHGGRAHEIHVGRSEFDGQVRNIPASSHLGIIYFSIVTPSLWEKVHVGKTVNQEVQEY